MDQRSAEARRNNGGTTWLTCDEIGFIQRLGTHTEQGVKIPRLLHLQRYREAMARRQEWGKIDQVAVRNEVERLIRLEQRKQSRKAA